MIKRLRNRQKRKPILDESGFTLLEIIAVLVILSIMAVVAVPKYFDLQEQARAKTIKTALAEGIGRMNGYFAQQVLSGQTPKQITYDSDKLGSDMGDFTLEVSPVGTGSLLLKVIGKQDTALDGYSAARSVGKPGF